MQALMNGVDPLHIALSLRRVLTFCQEPILGDFGLAFKTTPNDPNNPQWYNIGWGTDGFRAPEQMRWIDQGKYPLA